MPPALGIMLLTRDMARCAVLCAINPGPFPVNLRAEPDVNGKLVTTLDVGQSVTALAASSDGQWYQVVVPGKPDETAWVLATEVRLVEPTP